MSDVNSHIKLIDIHINPPNIAVLPGNYITLQVNLANLTSQLIQVQLSLTGLDSNWITMPATVFQLTSGAQVAVPITLHPPNGWQAKAKHYPFRIVAQPASGKGQQEEVASAEGQVTIQPVQQFELEIRPNYLRHGQRCAVTIHNQGNVAGTYRLDGQDLTGKIRFDFAHDQITVAPGEEESVQVKLSGSQRPLFGRVEFLPFDIQAKAEDGQTKKETGELTVAPVISSGFLLLLAALLLIGCLGGGTAVAIFNPDQIPDALRPSVGALLDIATATATSTSSPSPTSTLLPVSTPTSTSSPTATATATAIPETPTPTASPTQTPTLTPEPAATAEPTATNTATLPPTAPLPPPAAIPSLPFGFESNFGCWTVGAQKNGTLCPSSEQVYRGSGAGKIEYSFNTPNNDFVVFLRTFAMPEGANTIQLWVNGVSPHLIVVG